MNSENMSFIDLIDEIKSIIILNKKIFFIIILLCILLGGGIIIKNKVIPEYKVRLLVGSEVLDISILKVLVDDLNLQLNGRNSLSQKFKEKNNFLDQINDIDLKSIAIKPADEKDKTVKIYNLEFVFSDKKTKTLSLDNTTDLILKYLILNAKVNLNIAQSKTELERNIIDVDTTIAKAKKTELAIRANLNSKSNLSLIGVSQFYSDLNNLETRKNALEKNSIFYKDENLIYRLTGLSFDYNSPKKIEILAYCLFLGLFLSFLFIIYKLLLK